MDPPLPPPPPPPFYHPNLRYGNPIHRPNFIHPPFLSPPQLRPLFPPSPPHVAHRIPHHVASQHPSIIERSFHPHEFLPPPKPYPDFAENLPLRLHHDYRERNPSFRDEFCRGSGDNFMDRLPESLYARERSANVSDVGSHERYVNVVYRGCELLNWRDGDERRWRNGIGNLDAELYKERRMGHGISDRVCDFYNERGDDRRMPGYGIRDRGCQLYSKRDDDTREHGYCIDDRVYELDHERRGYGFNDRSSDLYSERDDQKRRVYGVRDDFLSQVENRQLEFPGSDLGLGRFSGRLGRRVDNEDFGRCKKKRKVPKVSALDRIELGKPRKRRSGGYSHQRGSKESSSGSFRGKEKEGFKKFETRLENGKEREQSPIELAISFKSNSLVAKTILASSSPAAVSDLDLTHSDKNSRNINNIGGSPMATSSKDMVATDVLTRGLDIQSDVPVSEELLKRSSVSEKKSTSTDGLDEIATENKSLEDTKMQGFNNDVSGQTRNRSKRKKKRARKQLLHKVSLQTTNDCGNITDYDINAPSAASQLNLNTALPEPDEVPDTEFALTGGTLSEEVDVEGDFIELAVPNSKRKRNSSTTLQSSMLLADNMVPENPVLTERLPTSIEVADRVSEIGTGEVAGCAHESSLTDKDTGLRDSSGFGQHADDVDMFAHNCTSPLYSGMDIIRTGNQFTSLGCYGGDIIRDHHFQDGQVLLESAFVKGLKVMVPGDGHDSIGSCRLEKTRNPEIILDKYSSETHQSCLAAETDNLILVKPEDITVSALGSADVNLKEFSANQADITQVGVNAIGLRSSDAAAVADCLNVNSGTTTNSNFFSIDHEGRTSAESKVSSLDNMSKQSCDDEAYLSDIVGSVEGSLEAINNVRTCFYIDQSSKVMMKRKAGDAQMDLSGPKIFEHLGTVSSVNDEAVEILVENSAVAVDFPCERDSYKEDDSFGVDSSFSGLRKKRRVVNARLGPVSPRLHETEAGEREDTHSAAFTATKICGTTDMEGDVCRDKFSGLDMDKILANDNKMDVEDELPFSQNLSSRSDDDIACVASYGDDLISSDSDVPSCPSSPDDLLLFPDFCFPEISGASPSQSSNGIFSGSDEAFNERPVSADPTTAIGKSLEKASLNNAQTASKSPLLVPHGASDVQKSNSIIGKSTVNRNRPTSAVPTVFPRYPPSINTSKKFPSAQFTKSRTWSRTGSASVAVTGPKLHPSPLPQSHATKMSTVNQSSYIRKGNSLVRKPSPSSVIPSPSHALSSSVYRLDPCIYNLKKSQASNSRVDGSTRQGIKHSNTFERLEALPINHSGKLLNSNTCNVRQSLSVAKSSKNSYSPKPLDTLYETTKLCAIAECKNGSSNNSDSGSTLDEGNLQKRITYVKRKSNQLVVAPNFEDTSTSGLCKTRTSLSDGYYKRKKNQIVRASVENHATKGEAMVNVNSSRLGSQTLPPKSYSKRQSGKGLSKAYRSSKFSLVWRLHNAQSSEKCNDSQRPRKVWSYLFPWKRATYRRNFILALGSKPNSNSLSTNSQKLPLSKKRGAVYTRSKHGYSLTMSKLLSVGGSSLKWSKSIEKNSKKANEEATRAVVAAEKRKKEGKVAVSIASKSRNSVSRKLVLNVKLRPGERIFRIGPDRYKMDPTRRTLQRITAAEPSPSGVLHPEKNVKRSYIPRRLFIGNNEYVRVGNGNQLVRDPKKRTRALASEKVRWSLRTARMRLAKKRKYCQFFTRFGKCNKDDGKCPYIHDPSKIVVCTKFLNGSCSNPNCKLTHKVMPERMEDCSYFLKGSCSNENCPYRHVNVNPNSSVCESFLRGYCADGNECQKKHTYVCPAFEATGICPQASTCKLHHRKKKTEKKPTGEEKIVRGRYFDGGLITADDCESEKLSENGKDDIAFEEGRYPDYISLDVSYDEVQRTVAP